MDAAALTKHHPPPRFDPYYLFYAALWSIVYIITFIISRQEFVATVYLNLVEWCHVCSDNRIKQSIHSSPVWGFVFVSFFIGQRL